MHRIRSFVDWRGTVLFLIVAGVFAILLRKLLHIDLWLAAVCAVVGLLLVGLTTFFEDE